MPSAMKNASASPAGVPRHRPIAIRIRKLAAAASTTSAGPWNSAADSAASFERLDAHVDQQERQQPDGQRQEEVHAAAPDAAQRRIEHQSDRDRQHADDERR